MICARDFWLQLQEFILRVKDGLEVCLCEVRQYLCMYVYIYICICIYDRYLIHRFSLFDFSVNQEQFQKKYQLRRFLYLGVWNGLAATPGDSRRLQLYRKILSRTPLKTLEVCMSKL